jgi:hypothetical protein
MTSVVETPVEVRGALEFLEDDRREDGLYSFSARLHGDRFVRDYEPWVTLRYSINTLLGLQAATGVPELVDEFAERWAPRTTHAADLGLFTVLLCERGDDERAADTLARSVRAANETARIDVQTLGWAIWGAAAAARRGIDGAHGATAALLRRLVDELVVPATGLPRHSAQRYRGAILSFGALVYYLRALHEAEQVLGDERAGQLFRSGVEQALALQGADGGWPWMLDAASGRVFDRYPLFTVHQDGMAMLFLHPAVAAGMPGAAEARMRSMRWALGGNELSLRMYADDPFVAYRAIQRAELLPRARRYARYLRHEADATASGVVVNRECRSYHLGWLLYAWAGR